MKKKLTKSRSNVVFTGTLAGVAEYFAIDPTIVRIIFVFTTLVGIGSPVFLYIVMAILIPTDRSPKNNDYGHNNKYNRNNDYRQKNSRPRKEAEKVNEDDWSDF
ncbi:PspC domain-containing protein [Enterococcus olivae]